jgi:hypothetical protein
MAPVGDDRSVKGPQTQPEIAGSSGGAPGAIELLLLPVIFEPPITTASNPVTAPLSSTLTRFKFLRRVLM